MALAGKILGNVPRLISSHKKDGKVIDSNLIISDEKFKNSTYLTGVKLTSPCNVDDSKQLGYSDDEDFYYPSDDDCVDLTPADYNYCYNY